MGDPASCYGSSTYPLKRNLPQQGLIKDLLTVGFPYKALLNP